MATSRQPSDQAWRALAGRLEGEVRRDDASRALYATDASVYREFPHGVVYPKNSDDLPAIVAFAAEHRMPLIGRGAGTSLAGQVVGVGLVVDFSRFMHGLLSVDAEARTARVQPGIVRNDLNQQIAKHGLFFAPETSTQNRATLGGMVGNNACGANSLVYGSTREHLASVRGVMSDGRWGEFSALEPADMAARVRSADATRESNVYRTIDRLLADPENRAEIVRQYPRPEIKRRNTGYAIDALATSAPYLPGGPPFNLCRLLAGSEGTLCLLGEITVNLVPFPPRWSALVCVHTTSVREALLANQLALALEPRSSELLDHFVFTCTRANPAHAANRAFIAGEPAAVLAVEFAAEREDDLRAQVARCERELRSAGLGYRIVTLWGAAQNAVWELRKAALGLLANLPGDAKPVAVIEDTAVAPNELVAFVDDVDAMLAEHGVSAVHYGHASVGVLHLRPILDLKLGPDRQKFRALGTAMAHLVKRYGGALSGEHGDGRVRSEFLPVVLGPRVMSMLGEVKRAWDPDGLFNPGKIVAPLPMDGSFRYEPARPTRAFATVFDFSADGGILRLAERCNGSGDCRKSAGAGGVMCPSYMATRREHDTTRARANILREVLTRSTTVDPFASEEIAGVMDLCLSCKGCKTECPSTVDMTKLKAEWLQHYHDVRGVSLRDRLFGYHHVIGNWATRAPWLHNALLAQPTRARWLRSLLGFAPARPLPRFASVRERRALADLPRASTAAPRRVWLFVDEFTALHEPGIATAARELLEALGYAVAVPPHRPSGRALLSKGFLRAARSLAIANVEALAPLVCSDAPLVGLEPSAILTFRDEVPALVPEALRGAARGLATNVFTLDEFIAREAEGGGVDGGAFDEQPRRIAVHVHCHQKALGRTASTLRALSLPHGHTVELIQAGCCGLAGSFGYEREHAAISRQIGELTLLPAVRLLPADTWLVAAGTSCRHQIADFTGRRARHPAEVLREALRR